MNSRLCTGARIRRLGNSAAMFAVICLFSSCAIYTPEKDLSPKYREFISQVRYITTRQERQDFVLLPDSEKDKFIEEFWSKRNPDLESRENEFKTEYFKRIDKANELFKNEGQAGWLTDRGRIYILYGPPNERRVSPVDDNKSRACQEMWFYGAYFLNFVDSNCSGKYKLMTLDLNPIMNLNINRTQGRNSPKTENNSFNFLLTRRILAVEAERIEGVFIVDIPYQGIWFGAEGGTFKTTLELDMKLVEDRTALDWEFKQPIDISLSASELKENRRKSYRIEIPFRFTRELDAIKQGKFKVQVVLKNKTGGEGLRKTFDFTVDKRPALP